jgi:hypothetical protein
MIYLEQLIPHRLSRVPAFASILGCFLLIRKLTKLTNQEGFAPLQSGLVIDKQLFKKSPRL